MTRRYDVIVVGAGMVGSAVGCALGRQGMSVALFDHALPSAFSPDQPPDLRVSALSPATEYFLRDIGAWSQMETMRMCPYRRMAVWEKLHAPLTGKEILQRPNQTLFDCRDLSVDQLGFIVENRVTQLAIHQVIDQLKRVDFFCPSVIDDICWESGEATLTLKDGAIFEAPLVVGADGAHSQVRQLAGIGLNSEDYTQQALVSTVEIASDQLDITWQAFTPTGPLALLPLSDDANGRSYASMVWYNLPKEVQRLKALSDDAFLNEMVQTYPAELPVIKQLLERGSFPLTKRHALSYVKPGIALVGDAAQTINPLAGQGVNLGFQNVATLVDIISRAYQKKSPFGELAVLNEYERIRRPANRRMQWVMDAFYYTFSNDYVPLKLLRNIGLSVAGRCTLGQKQVMKYAMGLKGI
ncbi:MAG: FAD-dependent monooxygenase [Endozoicomonadaceae bacterium]|nr:FAD-dependent monooxygenase [Endozoicomonadaceae bacterium]